MNTSYMIDLERYGIDTTDSASGRHPTVLQRNEFFSAARQVLLGMADVVMTEVVPNLDEVPGTWHPTGFMVFPLGRHPTLGSLRLHMWPAGCRMREAKGRGRLGSIYDGDIHDHAWSVASLVLHYYEDSLYSITTAPAAAETDTLHADPALFRVYSVEYGANAHNALTTSGACVRATVFERRSMERGQIHTIEAGVFHAPTIPDDRFGATLVFSSPRELDVGPHVLVGGPIRPIVGNRRKVSHEEAAYAKRQLLSAG